MKINVSLYAKYLFMALLFAGFNSCKKDDVGKRTTSQFKLTGTVTNNSDRGVNNASIELYTSSNTNATYITKTNMNGEYELSPITQGLYTIKIIGDGYNESSITTDINKDRTKNFNITGNATVNGTIINSQTGSGLAYAKISIMRLSTTREQIVEFVIFTDNYGNYELLGGATGVFTINTEANGFFTKTLENISFTEGHNFIEPQTIVEEPQEGSYRIVLSWGEKPLDLDSHLTGPNGDDRFHLYYAVPYFDDCNANLDVDDTYSFGPETITVRKFTDGMYRYSVHNYNDQSGVGGLAIETSPTKVELYNHDGLINTFKAPPFTGKGNTWRVFEMIAYRNNISIKPINIYIQASSDDDMGAFLNENDEKTTIPYLLNEL